MKFKVVGKRLILTDRSHEITKGENLYDEVEIIIPRYHDGTDNSLLSYRLTVSSENGSRSAAAILSIKSCTEENITLTDRLNENFSAVTGNVTFTLTCINTDGIVGKFSSIPFTIKDDLSLASLPEVNIAEQILNLTHLEAERAVKASQTPAPAEIYPATENQLGGVKVDGNTITASTDGTISASEAIKETQNLAVQIAHPNNFLIYDDIGKPSVMVAVPKFYLDDVIDGASHTVHPAFIINGTEHDIIYISKYQNIVENERAYSLPIKDPAVNVNFDQAWNYCKNKGKGWHLMTNAEWAAIALWCKKNGTMPKGNNYYGKDASELNLPQKAIPVYIDSDGKINRIATGSGPASWYHDGTFAGISDLNGNAWEWVSGLRLNNGEINIIENNNAADFNISASADSSAWQAILPNGTLSAPGTSGTLRYDTLSGTKFSSTATTPSAISNGIYLMESLGLLPHENSNPSDYGNDSVWANAQGERMPMRGCFWWNAASLGVFTFALSNIRTFTNYLSGFRSAYYTD